MGISTARDAAVVLECAVSVEVEMSSRARMTRFVGLAAALACLIAALAAVAVASPFSAPVLNKPTNGKTVHAGAIKLIVKDPGVPHEVQPVYVTIAPKRKVNKSGNLIQYKGCGTHCDFVALKPWAGHKGFWVYTAQFDFPGYWAATPGTYYWQAEHVAPQCKAPGCEVVSKIGTFKVVG